MRSAASITPLPRKGERPLTAVPRRDATRSTNQPELEVEITCYPFPVSCWRILSRWATPSGTSNLGQAASGFPETAAKGVAAPATPDGEPSEILLALSGASRVIPATAGIQ